MVTVCCGAAEKVFKIMNKFLITESTLPQCSLLGGGGGLLFCSKMSKLGKATREACKQLKPQFCGEGERCCSFSTSYQVEVEALALGRC